MATQLGKAYVQVVPTTKGISGMLSQEISGQAEPAAKGFSSSFSSKIASVGKTAFKAAGAGIAAIIGGSLIQGGKLQQSLGGVETLFKGSAGRVKQYASQAFKTAGLSANQYMEQATTFAAGLIQSLGGDTKKAADVANMAIIDMADNSNKMGTSMTDIQNAYQGFARNNYTMLDNLKLGYQGTRSEMQRLLDDAEKLTGVHYDINNLSDVFQAIHAIQTQLGITGTTAEEAARTLQGSFTMMKAAFSDFLGNLMEGNYGAVAQSMQNLAQSASIFLFDNLVPALGNILSNLPTALGTFAQSAGQSIMQQFGLGFSNFSGLQGPIESIKNTFLSLKDTITSAFSQMDFSGLQALAQAILPALASGFEAFMNVAGPAIESVVESFKKLWNAAQPLISIIASALTPAFQILGSFLGGVFKGILMGIQGLFDFLRITIQILTPVVNVVVEAFKLFAPAFQIVAQWIGTLIGLFGSFSFNLSALKTPIQAVKTFFVTAWQNIVTSFNVAKLALENGINAIKGFFSGLKASGTTLKSGLQAAWNGIKSAISSAKGAIGNAINGIKSFFNNLKSAGTSLKAGLSSAWKSIVSVVSNAKNSISNIINGIKNIFNSLKNINLASAGRAIIDSFLNGLKSAFEKVKNFVGGIAGWIKEHKGPIQYDRKLLIPAGKAIMQGLNKGLVDNFETVKGTVSGMAEEIADSMGTVSFDYTSVAPDTNRLVTTPFEATETAALFANAEMTADTVELKTVNRKLDDALDLMTQILDKDTDVYMDQEKVSAIVGRTIQKREALNTKYSNRRMGVID